MRLCFVAGLAGLLLLAREVAGETFTIATYNVENYVTTNRRVDGVYREAYPKPETEKVALRRVIRAADADVLLLEEMGPLPFLEELQGDLAAEGCRYPYAGLVEGDDPDRHLAVLSRKGWMEFRRHDDLFITYFGQHERVKRGLLELRFRLGVTDVAVFAVHLKSRLTERSDDPESAQRRADEARVVRNRIEREIADPRHACAIVAGDFNDTARSRPLELFLKRGSVIWFEALPAADSRGERWTHAYAREDSYSRIDYILVTPALQRTVRSARAWILDGAESLKASDHRPVVAQFDLP